MQIGVDAFEQATEGSTKSESEFIIVSGDADLLPAVKKITMRNFRVHIWSWKHALARAFVLSNDELIKTHELDPYKQHFGFYDERGLSGGQSIPITSPQTNQGGTGKRISRLEDSPASPKRPRHLRSLSTTRPCKWGIYCKNILKCTFAHGLEATEYFQGHNRGKPLRRYALCNRRDNPSHSWQRATCWYAHD
ncbi:hypothetical protein BDV96DRAFT_641652 [Lophiotrema nucula]|uniref:NYN domain-containing protein n=1 Tax=Lophiotrema nucula TaxID=690887 RepID=A0A6A5ZPC1_9PLEO|nr:hypothetical protein BDV96DRAFT_641652 [Lophiotrema nucula]